MLGFIFLLTEPPVQPVIWKCGQADGQSGFYNYANTIAATFTHGSQLQQESDF